MKVNYMPKNPIYSPKIINILEKSSLNLKNLIIEIKIQLNEENKRFSGKNFHEALIKLLESNKIAISGYDFRVHSVQNDGRIQSFMKEGVIFELIKTEQTDIISLLNKLESSDIEESKKAKNELFNSFKRKYRQIEKEKEDFYKKITKKVKVTPLKEKNGDINQYPELKHHNAQIWDFDLTEEDMNKIFNIKDNTSKSNRNKPATGEVGENIVGQVFTDPLNMPAHIGGIRQKAYTPEELIEELDKRDKEIENRNNIKEPLIDLEGKLNIKDFLEQKKILEPKKKSSEEIKTIFNKTFFFINSHENYKFMKQCFAWALSDEQDSIEWFNMLNEDIYSLKRKFKRDLSFK